MDSYDSDTIHSVLPSLRGFRNLIYSQPTVDAVGYWLSPLRG